MSRFTAAIFFLATGIGVLMFLVWPAYTSLTHSRDELANQNAAIDKLNLIIKTRGQLQEEYGSISASDSEKLNEMVPAGPGIRKLLVGVGALASQNNMALKNIDFTAQTAVSKSAPVPAGISPKQTVPYQTLPFHFSVSGSYESFLKFLNDIQLSARLIDITEIIFSGGRTQVYEFSIKANTYYLAK